MAFNGEAPAWFTGDVYDGVADRELLSDTEIVTKTQKNLTLLVFFEK